MKKLLVVLMAAALAGGAYAQNPSSDKASPETKAEKHQKKSKPKTEKKAKAKSDKKAAAPAAPAAEKKDSK